MKIVVVGGVAAGMSCAARARRLDEFAEIVVFERANHVSFANCGLPYHIGQVIKDRSRLLLQTPESLDESLAIDVRTAVEVTDIEPGSKTVRVRDLRTGQESVESYDSLALCPGASPVTPPLPGVDHPDIHVLRRIGDMDVIKAAVDGRGVSGRPAVEPAGTVLTEPVPRGCLLFRGTPVCCTGGMSLTRRTARPLFRVCLLTGALLSDDRHCPGS